MASLDFPTSPNDLDTYVVDNVIYTFNATKSIWVASSNATSTVDLSAVDQNILPSANLTYNIGSDSFQWSVMHANLFIGDGGLLSNVSGSGGATVTISDTVPGSASEGELYWDKDLGRLFIYYVDGDSSQWVEASPAPSTDPNGFTASIAGTPTELYRFSNTLYRGAKVVVVISDSPNFKIQELYILHDDSNVVLSNPYLTDNEVGIGSVGVEFTANINDGNVYLYATALTGSPTAKGSFTLIRK